MNWLNLLDASLLLQIEQVELGLNQLNLELTMVSLIACCPLCGYQSGRIHSHYQRHLQDLPWGKLAVSIQLNCRKFFCDSVACQWVIFTEPLPEFAARYARRTDRFQQLFSWLGLVLSGEAAARLSRRIFCPISGDTILRGLRRRIIHEFPVPRVLGLDDFAVRHRKIATQNRNEDAQFISPNVRINPYLLAKLSHLRHSSSLRPTIHRPITRKNA